MYRIENSTSSPSRRTLLKGGLATGFTLAFYLPVRAPNEPEQAPDTTDGQFAPNAFIRIDHSGKTTLVMPQVEMGQGALYGDSDDPCRRARCRFRQGRAQARAAEREALCQSDARRAGHRQFQFHPRVLEAAAPGRRRDARDAGAGRGPAMAGRSGKLHGREQRRHACRERALARLWRSGRCGRRNCGAAGSAAEGSKRLHADRQAAQAPRHAEEDQWLGDLRHRRHASGNEIRHARGLSGLWRQGRESR